MPVAASAVARPADEDLLGNPITPADEGARRAVDGFVEAFLGNQARAADVLKAAAGRPEHGLLNLYAGVLFMLMESPQGPLRAKPFLERAREADLNPRERRTADFLAAWMKGDAPQAQALGEAIARDWPRDLVMVKLCQYLAFNRGDAARMLKVALDAAGAGAEVAALHAMIAFGFEECHLLGDAERSARLALEMQPSEPWAQHALAHVMLAEARIDEGARFLEAASGGWTGLSSFMSTHNWWHLCLFWLSQGRGAAVLEAFDAHCWAEDQTYSQDQAGAVSLLARAEMAGLDVGDRWAGVAERVAERGVDLEQPFLALHYLYALCRAGRREAPGLLEAIRARAGAPGFAQGAWREAALPAAEGIAWLIGGEPARAVASLGRAQPCLFQVGGSHAQRDLFEQIWLAALLADGRWSQAQQALERRRDFDPAGAPLNRMLGEVYARLGLPSLAAEAHARAEAAAEAWAT